MIDSKIVVNIKTDKKGENIDFTYSRKDNKPFDNKTEELLVLYVEQLVRGMIDNGFYLNYKDKEDGKSVSK